MHVSTPSAVSLPARAAIGWRWWGRQHIMRSTQLGNWQRDIVPVSCPHLSFALRIFDHLFDPLLQQVATVCPDTEQSSSSKTDKKAANHRCLEQTHTTEAYMHACSRGNNCLPCMAKDFGDVAVSLWQTRQSCLPLQACRCIVCCIHICLWYVLLLIIHGLEKDCIPSWLLCQ